MIIHLFQIEKFTIPFINFINSKFDKNNHIFFVFGENQAFKKDEIKYIDNVFFIDKRLKSKKIFNNYIRYADKIIIHSLFIPNWMKVYFAFNKKYLKKSNWVIWGGDLYSYREKKRKIKEKQEEYLRKIIIKNIAYITTLVDNDYLLAQKWYKAKGIHMRGMYISPIKLNYLDEINKNKKLNYEINIQIGNSAVPTNNHIEVIDYLSKFKEKRIKVYAPLSYGNKEYALKVKKYGEKVLGDKFVGILNFMNSKDYSEFLGKIDIAIFNNDRQQGLGNIFPLAYLGAKIYMQNNTTMWNQLVEIEKYNFFSIKDLKNNSYDEFIMNTQSIKKKNIENSKKRFDEEYISKVWCDIFKV